ncbi:ADP-ribosylation factor-binding protein GGA2 isoform X1 [Podarcis lilfordi]|uniref:ADP-ribosylation factor-binding protein GGA2 isoform X1 n=2 Tax=Podarcis lilfordi TaxID=74358 RepID=A0AA35PNM3_9SAUR|nr:ADP-ribosylation factor-binding protein GGA2 isoform X1 [Podarcis lilfordi]
MARAAPPGALELLLHKATDPSNPEENWECIQRFSDQVNADADSIAAALKLLEHKIQSPQEAEALHALTVLEMCVNNCGENFHHEMGKFRFLNGLIKVLSPKYLGEWSTDRVKSRIVELLFSWMVWFPQEVKIRDAYQMLKKQGIVKQDPKLPEDKILPPPSPRPASSIFDADDEKSKLLTRLLKSKNPEDLQAANRLIKGMIREEQEKSAKVSRRLNALKEAHSNAEALEEMLRSWQESKGAGTPTSTLELLQATFAKCERLKPLLFRVASETVEDEEALGEVLQASDRLTRVLCSYKDVVGTAGDSGTSSGGAAAGPQPLPDAASSLTLIDLSELAAGCQAPLQENAKTEPFLERLLSSSSTHSLDEELMLGLPISPTAAAPPVSSQIPEMAPAPLPPCPASSSGSLAKLSIPLSSITLSTIPPVTVYEEKGLKAMLHFSRDPVPGQPATRVLVLSLLSTAPHPVQDIVFQAAVPKSMAIKLQPATGSELPAFNPLLPPTVISQVLLLANPHQAPLRLRYRLSFVQNGTPCIETGEVSDFPHAELWGGI